MPGLRGSTGIERDRRTGGLVQAPVVRGDDGRKRVASDRRGERCCGDLPIGR